jgi:hypothetical protein
MRRPRRIGGPCAGDPIDMRGMTMNNAITFAFADSRSAFQAFDTLEELGYRPEMEERDGQSFVRVPLEKNDLTSALEICQSFGGSLVERSAGEAVEAYSSAYALDEGGINIPAHIVNEDFSDEYLEGGAFSGEVHI